jgi:hypothetical protein
MRHVILKLLLFISILGLSLTSVSASPATSRTRTLNAKNEIVWTQDAYLPQQTITNLGLKSPQDAVMDDNDRLYIADRDNARIVIYDTRNNQVVQIISHPIMRTPTGLTLAINNDIYVADPSIGMVLRFSNNGELIEQFERPSSSSFGDTNFRPLKVAVDNRRNMYIVSEGVYNGVIQLSNSGEFLGYFTSNRVRLNLLQILQNFFFTEEQKALLLGRVPVTFTNVYVDNKGIVYTSTMGTNMHGVKKHNTAGQNMFANQRTWGPSDLVDLTTDNKGIVYAASKSGLVFVYTNDGQYIFSFGSSYSNFDIAGLFDSISSIAVDSRGRLWVLDGEKSFIQSFEPTEYAAQIYNAINLFNQGDYELATELWQNVLRLNQMSVLAHNGIGMNYMYTEQYDEAMFHFRIAGNRFYYSQAFWEVRNEFLQKYLGSILMSLISLFLFIVLTKKIRKKYDWLKPLKKLLSKFYAIKIVHDFIFMFDFLRHPIDSFYDLKTGKRGSLKAALLIYLVFFIVFLWHLLGKGFIFQIVAIEDVDLQSVIIGFFSILFLSILCNYLVSSINDGEGSFTQLTKMIAYSLAPFIIIYVMIVGLSFVLTYNETFLIETLQQGAFVWTGINIYIGVQEVHNYTVRESVRSILLTFVFILVITLMLLIIIIMTEQVYMFFEAIVKEVIRNVTS